MKLSGEVLRRRRLSLGITKRGLANSCGISAETITRLEKTGNPSQFSVETLMMFLRNLSIELNDAIINSPPCELSENPAPIADLGQLLFGHKKAIPKSEIGDCLGLTMEEVDLTIANLDESLRAVGLRILFASTGIGITTVAKSAHLDKALSAANRTRSFGVLNRGDLALLFQIMRDTPRHNIIAARNNGNVGLHKLENAGLIRTDGAGLLHLSNESLSALGCEKQAG